MEFSFERPTLYSFDPQTKEFISEVKAEVLIAALAENKIVFQQPAFSTDVAPPAKKTGFKFVWDGTAWNEIADHRGELWYRGEFPVRVAELGDPTSIGLQPEPPTPPVVVEDAATIRKRELRERLNEVVSIGGSYVALKQPVPDDIVQEQTAIVAELRSLSPSTVAEAAQVAQIGKAAR